MSKSPLIQRIWVLVASTMVSVAAPTRAQDAPADPEVPEAPAESPPEAPEDDGAETSARMAEEMSRTGFTPPVFRANGFGGDGSAAVPVSGPGLLAEGSFIADRQGILVPVGERDWGFVFDPDAQGVADRPMLLQPSLRLAEMVRLRASRDRTTTFLVSGRVMVHRGVNVLMPEDARLMPTSVAGESAGGETDRIVEANRALDPDAGEPSIDDLLARIEAARGEDDRGASGSGLNDAAAQARGDLAPEGSSVVSVRGRISRNAQGRLVFVRDGDAGPLNPRAGELVLLRCRNLEALEQLWQRYGDRFTVTVSGPVTVFEGSNFLLPLMFVVESRQGGELVPAQ